jgi:hypothetical protein
MAQPVVLAKNFVLGLSMGLTPRWWYSFHKENGRIIA